MKSRRYAHLVATAMLAFTGLSVGTAAQAAPEDVAPYVTSHVQITDVDTGEVVYENAEEIKVDP